MINVIVDSLPNTAFYGTIPPGKYVGLLYVFSGTNQSGQALTAAQLGTLKIYYRGDLRSNIDFQKLIYYNAFKGGSVSSTSSTGSSFLFTGFLPFVIPEDGVALFVENPDDWKVEIASTMSSTVVASGTVTVTAVRTDDADLSPYELNFVNYDTSQSAAGTFKSDILNKNVIELYIEQDANLTHLEVNKDGQNFCSYNSTAVYNAFTNYFTRTETFTLTPGFYFIDLNPSKELASAYAKRIDVNYTLSGSATLQMFYVTMNATPVRLARSAEKRNAVIERKAQGVPQSVSDALKSGKID